jgi:hypothetical protein
MLARLRWSVVFLALGAAPLAAQAPRITSSGDPSVKSDTIYRLAVDAADYPGDDFVYLLDDGVLRFESDGRGTRTYRQIVQILTREGAERWGEQTFNYTAGLEKLAVNWIKVVKPDGTVIADKPTHEQESLAPVALEAPIYSDSKVRRVSIGGVAPGTLLDFSWSVERLKPVLPGDFYTGWRVTTGRLVRRSRLVVDVPEVLTPRIKELNWHDARPVRTGGGRRVYTWAKAEVQPIESEPFAGTPNSVYVGISIAGKVGWGDIARWYAQLSKDRYALTPELESKVKELVAGAKTRDDSLRAIHRWVAQDFRYVSLSLGLGGYQPRTPASVLDTKYGDCKDKATLFIALARRLGFQAFPVLLSSDGGVERTLPSISQFDHMIAAVARPDASGGAQRYTFVDLTSDLTPWGELPPAEQGEFALVVHPDGRGEEVTLPLDSVSANRADFQLVGALSGDGVFTGRYTEIRRGIQQYALRTGFTRDYTADEKRQIARALANNVFQGATGDSLQAFNGRDLKATPRVSVWISGGRAAQSAGNQMILTLPLYNFAQPSVVADLESRTIRRFPIDVGAVAGPQENVSELRLRLPDGWRAHLPDRVTARSEFGDYTAEYRQEGQELVVVRTMIGRDGLEPPEKIAALVSWLRAVAKDDVKYIVLERTT